VEKEEKHAEGSCGKANAVNEERKERTSVEIDQEKRRVLFEDGEGRKWWLPRGKAFLII